MRFCFFANDDSFFLFVLLGAYCTQISNYIELKEYEARPDQTKAQYEAGPDQTKLNVYKVC